MESLSRQSSIHTRQEKREAHRYSSAIGARGRKAPDKENSKLKRPPLTKTVGSYSKRKTSSGKRWNDFNYCINNGDLGLDPGKIKLILDIIIDITRFDVDLVRSCLKPRMHKSAITELDNLRCAVESIWRLLLVNVKLVDCQKDTQQLPHPESSPSVPQSKHCQQQQSDCISPGNKDVAEQLLQSQRNGLIGDKDVRHGVLEKSIKLELDEEIDDNDTVEDDYMQTTEGDFDDFKIEVLSDDDVTSQHQEPSNNLGENCSLLNNDNSSFPEINVPPLCTELHQPEQNSSCVIEQVEAPDDVEMEMTLNLAEEQILSQASPDKELSLDHSHTTNSTKDGRIQSSRTDDVGKEFGVHQSEPAAGVMHGHTNLLSVCESDDCVVVEDETNIPSAGQNSKVMSQGRIPQTCEEKALIDVIKRFPKCSAIDCGNTKINRADLKFFRFPLDKIRCMEWVINCRRIDLVGKSAELLNQNNFLCALHFEQEKLSAGPKSDQFVPSIFSFPANPTDAFIPMNPGTKGDRQQSIPVLSLQDIFKTGAVMPTLVQENSTMTQETSTTQESAATIIQDSLTMPLKKAPSVTHGSQTRLEPPLARSSSVTTPERLNILAARCLEQMKVRCIDTTTGQEIPVRLLVKKTNTNLDTVKSGRFPCDKCDRLFIHRTSLLRHLKIHHRVKSSFPCELCYRVFNNQISLSKHIILHDRLKADLTCELCGVMFANKREINQHKRFQHKKSRKKKTKLKTCDRCGKRVWNLGQHLKDHEEYDLGITHSCDVCNKQFFLKKQLQRHMIIHNEKTHLCAICGKCFAVKKSLDTHQLCHTGEKKFSCMVCSKSFTAQTNLLRHNLIHTGEKPHECDICDKRFATSTTLKDHRRRHTREKPFKCTICGASFFVRSFLVFHKFKIHGVNEPNGKGEKPYDCPKCAVKLPLKVCLNYHLKFQCGDVSHRPRRVRENRVYCQGQNYHYHGKQTCNICGKIVSSLQSLIRHKLGVHEGQRPFSCDICSRSFKQKTTLDLHMWTHRPDKQYNCKLCDSGYADKRNLASHLRKVHNSELTSEECSTTTDSTR